MWKRIKQLNQHDDKSDQNDNKPIMIFHNLHNEIKGNFYPQGTGGAHPVVNMKYDRIVDSIILIVITAPIWISWLLMKNIITIHGYAGEDIAVYIVTTYCILITLWMIFSMIIMKPPQVERYEDIVRFKTPIWDRKYNDKIVEMLNKNNSPELQSALWDLKKYLDTVPTQQNNKKGEHYYRLSSDRHMNTWFINILKKEYNKNKQKLLERERYLNTDYVENIATLERHYVIGNGVSR